MITAQSELYLLRGSNIDWSGEATRGSPQLIRTGVIQATAYYREIDLYDTQERIIYVTLNGQVGCSSLDDNSVIFEINLNRPITDIHVNRSRYFVVDNKRNLLVFGQITIQVWTTAQHDKDDTLALISDQVNQRRNLQTKLFDVESDVIDQSYYDRSYLLELTTDTAILLATEVSQLNATYDNALIFTARNNVYFVTGFIPYYYDTVDRETIGTRLFPVARSRNEALPDNFEDNLPADIIMSALKFDQPYFVSSKLEIIPRPFT